MNIRIIATLLLMAACLKTSASVGLKLAHFDPRGDMGQYFKNSLSYEAYFSKDYGDSPLRGRIGLFYANMKPRLDSFPVYDVRIDYSTSTNTVMPGYLVYHRYRIFGMYIDQSVRVFKTKNFSAYAGIGLAVGHLEEVYDYGIESSIISNGADHTYKIGGLRTCAQAAYMLTENIQLCAELMHNWLTDTKWSGNYTHNTIGVGFYYYFNSQKD